MDKQSGKISSNRGIIKYGVPQGSILGPLLFFLHINDLPPRTNTDSKLLLYADNASVFLTGNRLHDLPIKSVIALNSTNKWFTVNRLSLNLDKMKVMKCDFNYSHNETFQSFYKEELCREVINTQFVCLEIDKYMNWKNPTVHILPKLSSACYSIR